MELKQSRSIGLIIRRLIAVFILFSTISGVVAAVETNSFNDDVIPGIFVSLILIYFLARPPRKKTKNDGENIEGNKDEDFGDGEFMTGEECIVVDDYVSPEEEQVIKELEEQEKIENEYRKELESRYFDNKESVNKTNPVRDKQSFLSRIFQGKTDRY